MLGPGRKSASSGNERGAGATKPQDEEKPVHPGDPTAGDYCDARQMATLCDTRILSFIVACALHARRVRSAHCAGERDNEQGPVREVVTGESTTWLMETRDVVSSFRLVRDCRKKFKRSKPASLISRRKASNRTQ